MLDQTNTARIGQGKRLDWTNITRIGQCTLLDRTNTTRIGQCTRLAPDTGVTFADWRLVFRLQSGTNVPAYETWVNNGKHDDEDPTARTFPLACLRMFHYTSCDQHFRSHILDDWKDIAKVYLSLIKNDEEVAYIQFDATGTDMMSWFDENKITESSWLPGLRDDTAIMNPFTGIRGHCKANFTCRRFYFHGPYVRCEEDWYYLEIYDFGFDNCDYDRKDKVPNTPPSIAYSPSSGRASFASARGDSSSLQLIQFERSLLFQIDHPTLHPPPSHLVTLDTTTTTEHFETSGSPVPVTKNRHRASPVQDSSHLIPKLQHRKRHNRRFIKHEKYTQLQQQAMQRTNTVVNLSSYPLRPAQSKLLIKNLSFCPTLHAINYIEFSEDVYRFCHRLRLAEFFCDREGHRHR
ncbi:hemicentin-1 [Elysia marginata]|uniref:Hemicentin-1 n=1 Tax=Elysia marginata TaxID=1093978 RepID=A0AAV4GSX9_9GAST|nr:hemicentin-1 [Elysia marginata]